MCIELTGLSLGPAFVSFPCQHLLKSSVQVHESLLGLQEKADLMDSVFDGETSGHLQDELCAAVRNRELLHTQLQQRKSRLEVRGLHRQQVDKPAHGGGFSADLV